MARPKRTHWNAPAPDVAQMVLALANVRGRDDTIASRTGTKWDATALRNRFYYWRTAVTNQLASGDLERAECEKWLSDHFGKRVTRDWLYYNAWAIEEIAIDAFRVVARVRKPMYGDDIRFMDQLPESNPAEMAEMMRRIREGLANATSH